MPYNTTKKKTKEGDPLYVILLWFIGKETKTFHLYILCKMHIIILGWKILAIKIRFQPTNKHSINLAIDHFNSKKI